MLDWFSNLELLPKIYWSIALVASFVFVIVMILAFVGGDTDDIGDVDSDIDGDSGIGFQFLTFKNVVSFFTIFGWEWHRMSRRWTFNSINLGYLYSLWLIDDDHSSFFILFHE